VDGVGARLGFMAMNCAASPFQPGFDALPSFVSVISARANNCIRPRAVQKRH
jgi:hypothetical protein